MADASKSHGHGDDWVEEEDVGALLSNLPDEDGDEAEVVPDFGIEIDAPGAADATEAGGGGVTGDFGGVLRGGMAGDLAEGIGHNRLPVDTKEGDAGDPIGELFGHPPGGDPAAGGRPGG